MKPCLLPPVRAVAVATAALVALTAVAAVVVAVIPGLSGAVRSVVSVGLYGVPRTPREAASIASHNVLIAGAMLLVAALAPRLGRGARLLCDALVLSIVVRSAVLVGTVLGAAGSSLLPYLVHLPLEWAGLGVAAGAWLRARRASLSRRDLAALICLCVLLLSIAAVIETYATPR